MRAPAKFHAALGALTIAVLALAAAPAPAQTVDEILDQHFAALGGRDKIAAVQSAKVTLKQQAGGQEIPLTLYWKRPDKVRVEISYQGMVGIQAYDGTTAWQVMPFLGKTDPESLTGDDLKQAKEQADVIEGPLFNYKEKGNTVELIGKENTEGTETWKLRLTSKDGDVSYVYLDAESMLEIKSERKLKRGDVELEFEGSLGDYKEVDGILFAHSTEQKQKGAPEGATYTIEKVELGVAIDDAIFAMPAAKTEEKPTGN
jgi:outer membrane lipoprotein-sorting protein